MHVNKCFLFITGMITFIFTLAIFVSTSQVHAYSSSSVSEVWISFVDPAEIEAKLIRETIKTYNPQLTEDKQYKIEKAIKNESSQTGFDPLFISSIIAAESSFEPEAVSPCAARGLMQLTDEVSQIMQINNPFDVNQNIYAGTRYLQYLRKQFDDPDLMLAAYNAGPTRVAGLGRIPRISETINYIRKVTSVHQMLKDKFCSNLREEILNPPYISKELSVTGRSITYENCYQDIFHNTEEIFSCENKQPILYSGIMT